MQITEMPKEDMIAEDAGVEPSNRSKSARSARSKPDAPPLAVRRSPSKKNGSPVIAAGGADGSGGDEVPTQGAGQADYIIACISDLTTIAELGRIQAAVDRRRTRLQKPPARKRRKAAG